MNDESFLSSASLRIREKITLSPCSGARFFLVLFWRWQAGISISSIVHLLTLKHSPTGLSENDLINACRRKVSISCASSVPLHWTEGKFTDILVSICSGAEETVDENEKKGK